MRVWTKNSVYDVEEFARCIRQVKGPLAPLFTEHNTWVGYDEATVRVGSPMLVGKGVPGRDDYSVMVTSTVTKVMT